MKGWRRDKKPQVSPYLDVVIIKTLRDMANFIGEFDGETGRQFTMAAYKSIKIIEQLGPFMLRDYARGYRIWCGNDTHKNLDSITIPEDGLLNRFPMRFSQSEWLELDSLAFSLGRRVAPTVAALIMLGLNNKNLIREFAPGFELYQIVERIS